MFPTHVVIILDVVAVAREKHACGPPPSSYSHMPPQFETVKVGNHVPVLYQSKQHHPQQSFANVPITLDGVETSVFLEAADGLMDLFGKFIIPSQQLRLSLNPLPPIKISWAAPSLHLSSRISEVTLPYVRPLPRPAPPRPLPPFFFFVPTLHFRGSALGTMPISPCQKLSRTSFGLRRGRAGLMAQHVWSV